MMQAEIASAAGNVFPVFFVELFLIVIQNKDSSLPSTIFC